MTSSKSPSLSPERHLSRSDFLVLLDTAISVGELRYARRLATSWLAAFPGDLPVKFQYAQAIVQDGHLRSNNQALDMLESICNVDPEYIEAQELLASLRQREGLESHYISKGCLLALSSTPRPLASKGDLAPIWARQLHEARQALAKFAKGDSNSLEKAEHAIHQALIENPDTPLAALTHLSVMAARPEMPSQALLNLAQIYHERWPECLQFSLILAHRWMESGDSTQAVDLLHQAVAKDITGQVPQRLWGNDHPYRALWPFDVTLASSSPNSPQSMPVPASVAGRLGWNQLASVASEVIPQTPTAELPPDEPEPAPTVYLEPIAENTESIIAKSFPVNRPRLQKNLSEPIRAVQTEFNRLAKQIKAPHLADKDGNFPVYVVLTTRKGLEAQYGAQSAQVIDEELKKLVRLIRGRRINHESWGAILFYADDPEYTSFFELQPVAHKDPWAIKLLLTDLDVALRKGGERIGTVLIVGGPEVVPFHSLPNPVDDADNEVFSDNPYASLDENYFILEWPLGRLPGGSSSDSSALLANLRSLSRRYANSNKPEPWYTKIISALRQLIRSRSVPNQYTFGYTAAIWRRAALAVYRTIGDPQELLISPPIHACEEQPSGSVSDASLTESHDSKACLLMPSSRLAYFNLHGISDSSFWYGHRDPTEPLPGLEFPVALRPQDVRNGGSAPQLIFSEACYGAHIQGKNVDDALSLKFLASGTHAIIGSTCISYGSISTPLSAADLLGRVFYSILEEGIPAGEALRRAKLHLVREMHRRQGYLDPEDQKTLISFILFGDPLAQPYQPRRNAKSISRRTDLPSEIQTISENPNGKDTPAPVSPEMVTHVKSIVAQYLPGMTDARLRMSQTHTFLADLTPDTTPGSPNLPQPSPSISHLPGRQVVTLSKTILQSQLNHAQYARLTMDASGKLLKLTVSR